MSAPGWVLFATSLGFGALARDSGLSIEMSLLLTAALYALPAQVVFVDQLARDAGLFAAAIAVMLTAIRLLPMTVSMVPFFRGDPGPGLLKIVAVHFVAITSWLEGQRRLPLLPPRLRLAHFIGIGSGMIAVTLLGTTLGFYAAASVPVSVSAALLLATPIYFLLSLVGVAREVGDSLAIALGLLAGPALFVVVPGLDLLATGVICGTIAFLIERRRKVRP
ncbi:MAG: AzlC family ABC transporter permease [Pseudomonadota bacterium]